MNSRERVIEAINHREPDMVPIDIGGTTVTGFHVDTYLELSRALDLDLELPRVFDPSQLLARTDLILTDWFHSDVVQLENQCVAWDSRNKDWRIILSPVGNQILVPESLTIEEAEDGTRYILSNKGDKLAFMPPGCMYFEFWNKDQVSCEPRMTPEEWAASIPLLDDEELRCLEARAKILYENTEYAIVGGYNKAKFQSSFTLFAGMTFSDWLCELYVDPEYCKEVLEAASLRHVKNLGLYFQAVGKYINVIQISPTDFGTQKAEFINPEVFAQIVKPNMKIINDYVHSHSDAKTFYHSCGSIRNTIEHMIEAGIDIINPVQTTANNMDPQELKNEFGDRITFWGGGVDTQSTLPYGTPEEIKEQVAERMNIFGKGGGYVFAANHNIQPGAKPENLIAFRDAAIENR